MGNYEQLTRRWWPMSSDSVTRRVQHESISEPSHMKKVILGHIPFETVNKYSIDIFLYFLPLVKLLSMRVYLSF